MIEGLPRQRRSQPEGGRGGRALESCPRSVADSWRPVARRYHEACPDSRCLVLRSRVPRPQSAARDLRRSPRQADHLSPAKKTAVCSGCGTRYRTFYDRTTRRVRDTDVAGRRLYLAFEHRRVACARCQGVKVERLDWLAQNPRYTQRFAQHVGTLCRDMSNKAVMQLLHLHEHTVKDLDTRYMQAWLAKTPQPAPRVIGVDELSIKKGHTYRIVVSDLEHGRPIWVGGQGRTEADLDRFFADLGPQKAARIRLAVMDMWKAFRNSVQTHAPQAQILFDKFHILRHLADAMDQVRRAEYHRVTAKDRAFIKGQRYTLLSHRANLTLAGRRSLRKLLQANKRLATAYLLKEEFGQLWAYRREGWARQFFTRWQEQLKWQRLRPFEKFAALIERHWEGIAAYCTPRNKVKLGFVEGLNNKIRVIQRRAYG
ncbi:MAG: ISL3 family transposase, partial [Nitrospirota bacterium]